MILLKFLSDFSLEYQLQELDLFLLWCPVFLIFLCSSKTCVTANTSEETIISSMLYLLALGEKDQSVWLEILRVSKLFSGCAHLFLLVFCWGEVL